MNARPPSQKSGADDTRAARKVMARAMRRLNVLEWILLGAAAIASLVGGWLVALLARAALGLPFRATWMIASLLLFLCPGAMAWAAERRSRSAAPNGGATRSTTNNQPERRR